MDKLLCTQQPVRPLQGEIDLSWQDDAVGDAVPADEAVEEAEPDAVEVIGASEDERKEKHVEQIDDEKDDEKNERKDVEQIDDEKNDEKNEVEEVVEGEKDEEQIAEETDIKNTWWEVKKRGKKTGHATK